MNNKAHLRPKDFDSNGDIIPTSWKEERPKGEWIKKENRVSYWYECNKCGERPARNYLGNEYLSRFCPNCGSDMRGEEE